MTPQRIPSSTYRLQLAGIGLRRACELVDYLHALGIGDLYASPVLQAGKGSTHGYDVTDPHHVHAELGTEADFDALAAALRARGMGLLLDIVPNHMASSPENPWWRDVLEHGPASPYAHYFDIDWSDRDGAARLIRPVLGDRYGVALEAGQLPLGLDEDGLHVSYYGRRMPLDPKSYAMVLEPAAGHAEDAARRELLEVAREFAALPDRAATGPAAERRRLEANRLRGRLRAIVRERPDVRAALLAAIESINGRPGDAASFDSLDAILHAQPYRLTHWQLASRELNYRRFFDIADLVGVRVEEEDVFDATHALVFRWIGEGKVTGLRIDHVDGLIDPTGYLTRLQQRLGGDFYIVVEKILAHDEALAAEWPVAGTTGYEFAVALTGLFADERGVRVIDRAYRRLTGVTDDFAAIVYAKKKQIMEQLFAGEMEALAGELKRLARDDRHARDASTATLQRALVEVTACLGVYRTYIRSAEIAPRDRERLDRALREARSRLRASDADAVDFLRRVLLLERGPNVGPVELSDRLHFVQRWQQMTGPVMAKGFEDSALYVYNRLLALNEVGGEPGAGWHTPASLHERLSARADSTPHSLNATSTHDTKRGEDVRARLAALSGMAGEWTRRAARWRRRNRGHRERIRGRSAPDANEEFLIYQTLLGAWPLEEPLPDDFRGRIEEYLTKALREARIHSSWLRPDQAYEDAVHRFLGRILDDARFVAELRETEERVAFHGALGGLAQVVIKATAPGVPDFYQGSELWDLSLVDPDNRRPVDFDTRVAMLRELDTGRPDFAALREGWRDGRVKLWTTSRALRFRRERHATFEAGEYLPLPVEGRRRGSLFAFARRAGDDWSLTVAPCRSVGHVREGALPSGAPWRGAVIPLPEGAPSRWRNVLTGAPVHARDGRLRVPDALGELPVAILASE